MTIEALVIDEIIKRVYNEEINGLWLECWGTLSLRERGNWRKWGVGREVKAKEGRALQKEGSSQKRYMQSVSIYPKKVMQKKANLFAQRMSQ